MYCSPPSRSGSPWPEPRSFTGSWGAEIEAAVRRVLTNGVGGRRRRAKLERQRQQGGAPGRVAPAGGDGVVVQVAEQALARAPAAAAAVLPHHHVRHVHLPHAAQHLDLLVADVLGVQADLRGTMTLQKTTCQMMTLQNVDIYSSPPIACETPWPKPQNSTSDWESC